jgi:hypothetical protein
VVRMKGCHLGLEVCAAWSSKSWALGACSGLEHFLLPPTDPTDLYYII